MSTPTPNPRPDMQAPHDTRPRTAVLLQFTGIGDLVWHLVYFKALAEQSQAGKITLIAQPSTMARAFVGQEPWIDSIIDHDHRPRRTDRRKGAHAGLFGMWKMGRTLGRLHFDRIILFSGRASRGLIAAFSGIPRRIGYGYNPIQRLFLNTPPYIAQHPHDTVAAYHEATALMVAHGFCRHPIVPTLTPPPANMERMQARLAHLPRPLYAFVIGTSEAHKQWGTHNYAMVAKALIEKGGGVLIVGGPAEAALANEVCDHLPASLRSAAMSFTDGTVLDSAAALSIADVCIGNDTGMVHVAAAAGTPSYILLGPRPRMDHDSKMHMIEGPTLVSIRPEQVLAAIPQPSAL